MRRVALLIPLLCLCCQPPPIPKPEPYCTYPRVPLQVAIDADLSWQVPAYDRAFASWNTAIGFQVFEWGRDMTPEDLDVVVLPGKPIPGSNTVATTHRMPVLGACKSAILIRKPMDNENQAYVFAMHELGHALGVGHSGDPSSVMQPRLADMKDFYRIGERDWQAARVALQR